MFRINKTSEQTGEIYPDAEYFADYKNSDIGAMISVLGVEAVIGQNVRQVGDSGVYVQIEDAGMRGDAGIEQLKDCTSAWLAIIDEALPHMSAKYKEFYQHFLDDFDRNGLCMPIYGKIM